ncbi:MAG TPA: N-acetyltransferase [Bryobacteraceae bacterium]|nr:N-acetyltransferase [Bryobacteraceae bacterium]
MVHDESLIVRGEDSHDRIAVRTVNETAFERSDEAGLVDSLRLEGAIILSLVAVIEEQVVGHILFSRMWIDDRDSAHAAVALAPMAVLPAFQRQGIGGKLIRSGLDALRGRGERIVIVLGHAHYYPRFGFSTEKARGLASPFPPEAYMAAELASHALNGIAGTVRYPVSFGL